MAKYSFEFKKKVVTAYLSGDGGAEALAKKFGIKHKSSIDNWVKCYQSEGNNGLYRSRQNKVYSFEYKCSIVELYLTSELSVPDIAYQEKIHNPSMITNWINRYRAAGPDALRNQKRGRKQTMNISDDNDKARSEEINKVNTSDAHVKELEAELLKLRIENAFLKELRRLRLEDEAKTRDLPESSTASEDNANEKIFSRMHKCLRQHICIGKNDLTKKIQTRPLKIRFWKYTNKTKIMGIEECAENF